MEWWLPRKCTRCQPKIRWTLTDGLPKSGNLGTINTLKLNTRTQRWPQTRSRAVRITRQYVYVHFMVLTAMEGVFFSSPLFRANTHCTIPGTKRTSAKIHWVLVGARSVQISFILRCTKAKLSQKLPDYSWFFSLLARMASGVLVRGGFFTDRSLAKQVAV